MEETRGWVRRLADSSGQRLVSLHSAVIHCSLETLVPASEGIQNILSTTVDHCHRVGRETINLPSNTVNILLESLHSLTSNSFQVLTCCRLSCLVDPSRLGVLASFTFLVLEITTVSYPSLSNNLFTSPPTKPDAPAMTILAPDIIKICSVT